MELLLTLLTQPGYLTWPDSLVGWLVWAGLLALVAAAVYHWRVYATPWSWRQTAVLVGLLLLVPLTSLTLGIRLPPGSALPQPLRPIAPTIPALMIFGAVPWVLAAGFLGPLPAAVVGGVAGMLLGYWDTHTPFTSLEYAALGVLFSATVRQRYRTRFYRLLRRPAIAAAVVSVSYPLLFLTGILASARETFLVRLDFALTWVGPAWLSVAGQLIIAGIVAEILSRSWREAWGGRGALQPSPAELSLEARFTGIMGTLIVVLALGLMVGDWLVAESAARRMLRQRLGDTAELGADTLPFFLEAGQNLILQFSQDQDLYRLQGNALSEALAGHLRSAPYFSQLFVLDEDGEPVDGYPKRDFLSLLATPEEQVGIDLALQGVVFQYYTVPPVELDEAALISFIAAIKDADDQVRGVLLGRTDLAANPFTKPILNSLDSLTDIGGSGMLLDEEGRILYHPVTNLIMSSYTGRLGDEAAFFDETAPDGTRSLVYYQPVSGRNWAIVLTVSAQQVQQVALDIAAPLLLVLLVLAAVAVGMVRYGVQRLTGSLHDLSTEADRITAGDLTHALGPSGVDEVGRLRTAFEQMRVRLRARLEELNQLFLVSQGVAASLEAEASLAPVLKAALETGASTAYVVLLPERLPGQEEKGPSHFAAGQDSGRYDHLHPQILALTRQQKQVVISNPSRARSLKAGEDQAMPGAILAVALRHESLYYGAFWVAYDDPHPFEEQESNFLLTLASQAALAAANARHYYSAEVGRRQLEAVLASSPEPVLMTDRQNRLLLANPAAVMTLMDGTPSGEGTPIRSILRQKELVDLLEASDEGSASVEVELADGRYYYATVTSVIADGKRMGRVCVMQDITRFKELDEMKSEFVASVSHDLRSPLTLMRGYTTMLNMVGDLNEQQTGYMRKILLAVNSMTRLVENLLDLTRIEAGVGLKVEKVPLLDIIDQVKGAQQLHAAQKKIDLSVEIPPHVTTLIEADQALLQQAIQNLVENAIKYTDPGGRVILRLTERDQNVVIEVQDTGIGIAPVDQPRLFEPFFRGGRRETRQQRGSGLGLAIVKSIAERHGGRVWVDSQLGQGSRFYLEIPIEQKDRRPEVVARRDLA